MTEPRLVVPPLTPFGADLLPDWNVLSREIDYIVEQCRATDIVAAGVEAQEYHYLDMATRRELIARTIEFTAGRRPVIVGVSHPDFRTAIALANHAERLGAASIQLLAPNRAFGGPANDDDVVRYFEAVAAETSLPIVLYLNAGPGADVSVAGTIALAKLPRVVMIKESSRDLARVSRLIVEIDTAGHARYLTTVQMLLITLMLGGSGATMPPPVAEIARGVIDHFVAGRIDKATELQLQFALFPARWMHRGLTPTMKAAMALIGRPIGGMYPPWQGLTEAETAALETLLRTTALAPQMSPR